MNHRFHTPLSVYRVSHRKDPDGYFNDRKSGKVMDLKCVIVKTETTEKTDEKPVLYIIKKTIGIPKKADIRLSDEIVLVGRRYLVIDVIPRRYWKELRVICEVKGNERA